MLKTSTAQSADWLEALERTGATVSVDHHEDSIYDRLGSKSYDVVMAGGTSSAAKTSRHLLGRLRKLGFRTPFVFLGKWTTPRDRKALMKEGALACTEDLDPLMQTLAGYFARPRGRYAGRKLLWQANPTPESTRFCYGLAAEGIHFYLARREKLSFAPEPDDNAFDVIVVRNAKLIPRRPGDVTASTPRHAIGPRTKFILFGASSPEQRHAATAAGALVVAEDHRVLRNVLDCCALARFEGYLSDQQAARFVGWATPRHSPAAIETLLRATNASQRRQLWAKCKSPAELCRTAVEILTVVFDSRRVEIWRGAGGEDQVPVAENKNVKSQSVPAELAAAREAAAEAPGTYHGPEVAQVKVTSFPVIVGETTGEPAEWGSLYLGPMNGEAYTKRQEEWVIGIVKSLGQAIAGLEGTGPIRGGIPKIAFKRGVSFLCNRSRSRTRAEAEHLIGTPDSPAWVQLGESFTTEVAMLEEFLALLVAMWRPEHYELWAVIDRELRFLSGSAKDISEPDPVVAVAKGTGRIEEFSQSLPIAVDDNLSRLGIPIRLAERALPLGFIGLVHTAPEAFRGAAAWIQKLFSTGLETLRRMERMGGIAAELQLPAEQKTLLEHHHPRSATAALVYRAARRALPLLILTNPPRFNEFDGAMARVQYLLTHAAGKLVASSSSEDLGTVDPDWLKATLENARHLALDPYPARSTVETLMLTVEAVVAQGILCLQGTEAGQLRNFFFLCNALSELAANPALRRSVPPLWSDRLQLMLQSDSRTVLASRTTVPLEKFGTLWQDLNGDTPWSLPSREGGKSPRAKIFVAGLAGAVLGKEAADACRRVGRSLARLNYGLIVGSYSEVDTAVARAFVGALPSRSNASLYLTQLVDAEYPSKVDGGEILIVSPREASSPEFHHRAAAIILINGGYVAADLAGGAEQLYIPVLPLPGTGGTAKTHYDNQLQSEGSMHAQSPVARHQLLNEEIPVAVDLLFRVLNSRLQDRPTPGA